MDLGIIDSAQNAPRSRYPPAETHRDRRRQPETLAIHAVDGAVFRLRQRCRMGRGVVVTGRGVTGRHMPPGPIAAIDLDLQLSQEVRVTYQRQPISTADI